MEETIGVTSAAQIPKQRGDALPDTAARYAEERHWDVFPGTWMETVDGVPRCSCGDTGCAEPGAHPAREDWATQATGSATVARRLWAKQATASILMPTGRTFDAIDVPETAGFLALARMERMELTLGPVTCTPDRRMQFFVLPGAAAKVPDLVRKLGWPPASLDLVTLGEGAYVAAPPTRFGTKGAVQWACRPTAANRWLPDAEEIVSPLAYACGREARR
ncbi:DNA primase [Streptomyces sp. SID4919]|uniref:bifunctional DNA primase/polymerase n=1 Tax=Streptomyces TaxID=1883 RepID=UPI000823BBCD|nr:MULTISPECIES: bifunctional DNA primase/polymerase [Streptomyces]MYY11728.1 DNA primase [Streptomyces sp. SID4919]MCX4660893.1 bifunctional DNA primase/polymerase [Streptomyces uncialis]WST68874.1 bifunctional DNA primase/polymerase [Streptomyces uncialis]WTE12485.1 bifunctional DNA primase/polymerase [Streptomyces uncialis]SCK11307.1 Bifunctional DNA primase/polymerase, N-terminal [Streptomyces sp. AmelKG-E11A]